MIDAVLSSENETESVEVVDCVCERDIDTLLDAVALLVEEIESLLDVDGEAVRDSEAVLLEEISCVNVLVLD